MRKSKLLLVLFSFILVLSVVQIIVSNRLSTTGIALGKIDQKVNMYNQENEKLREQLLTMSSLTQIASVASSLGFVSNKSQVVLTAPLPIAIRN